MAKNGVSFWNDLSQAGDLSRRFILSHAGSVGLIELAAGSSLESPIERFYGRSVCIRTKHQLTAALAIIELDGIARRIVLCPPDLPTEHVSLAIQMAEADTVVSDDDSAKAIAPQGTRFTKCTSTIAPGKVEGDRALQTEWVLFTSGSTGLPKLVLHTLTTLHPPNCAASKTEHPVVWSTFYDIRRYGGLQVFLRALLGGASLILSSAEESTEDFLSRAGASGLTHISGTPTHWRKALMSSAIHRVSPDYIRLSGEMVDQMILDSLRATFPHAEIVHAFASTEAGVAFEVTDCKAGFPASFVGSGDPAVEMKIENGSLQIRSARRAIRYLGDSSGTLTDRHGFVDTHDLVELRGDRYYFVGRADRVINVGGLKVHPEEVETVINQHPEVRMSLVKGRRNPVTGELVIAEVVLRSITGQADAATDAAIVRNQILEICRRALPPYKVPAAIQFVPALEITPSGKLARA
jgi:acyl-coenzyme A synthetase/AMP-(fatty) acid ligase